ncbi:MAG TPA: PDGLE domain-containing protein [bacterium]|nr:PDGLE domain-containing protein [bacterium]HQL60918.1 PDGLE domain-containing protein [bacterium]
MTRKEILTGLGLALFVAIVLSPFASSSPDGLERVAEDHQFVGKAAEKSVAPEVFPDYTIPGVENKSFSTAIAGGLGTLILYFGGFGLARLLASRRDRVPNQSGT